MKSQLAVLAIATAALLGGCEASDDAERVVGELTSDRVELVAEFAEPVVELLVTEGESVTAGQVLMRQDSTRAKARLAEAEAALLALESGTLDELLGAD